MPGLRQFALAAALSVLLPACGQVVSPPPAGLEASQPAGFPEAFYRMAAARGEAVFRIDAGRSRAVLLARRGGPLARVGHDHVVASRQLQGYALMPGAGRADAGAARADVYVSLEDLEVDDPALRAEAGLTTAPSPEDIAGTRRNMLEKVLESRRHPFMSIRVRGIEAEGAVAALATDITLHGVTRALRIPAAIESDADNLMVAGRFSLRQTDFGITPYSILGGVLQVEDQVDLTFEIHARRMR